MAKKLVLDRPIERFLSGNERITVPDDEVWRVSVLGEGTINGISFKSRSGTNSGDVVSNALLGAGSDVYSYLASTNTTACMITGIAFKLQEV